MAEPTAPTDGVEATFTDVGEIAWTEVQRQRNADGTVSVVRERWPIFRPDFLSAYVVYEPGMVVRRHGHRSNHVVVVLDGGAWLDGAWCEPGTHVHVPLGATFGPIVAGPDGVTCWELSFGEFGGWGDEPESYEREIEARGVTPLPDPPLQLADWFVDPRGDTGAERPTPRVPGLAETVTPPDQREWREVLRQQRSDGTVAAVRAAVQIAEPTFTSAAVAYDPGVVVRRHGFHGRHLLLVTAGGGSFDGRWCPAGTHVEVPVGAAIGPIVAGDEGMETLELTDGDVRSWGERPDLYEEALGAQGATPLPDPALDLGPSATDTRRSWSPPAPATAT